MDERNLDGLQWRKSSRSSGNGECVEAAARAGRRFTRDSKNPGGGMLETAAANWRMFVSAVKRDAL